MTPEGCCKCSCCEGLEKRGCSLRRLSSEWCCQWGKRYWSPMIEPVLNGTFRSWAMTMMNVAGTERWIWSSTPTEMVMKWNGRVPSLALTLSWRLWSWREQSLFKAWVFVLRRNKKYLQVLHHCHMGGCSRAYLWANGKGQNKTGILDIMDCQREWNDCMNRRHGNGKKRCCDAPEVSINIIGLHSNGPNHRNDSAQPLTWCGPFFLVGSRLNPL